MSENLHVTISMLPIQVMLKNRGLDEHGRANIFLLSEIKRLSDPYVPMDTGTLKNQAKIITSRGQLIYGQIYARYQWGGKVMVGRPPKRVTNTPLKYGNGTRRGKEWCSRMLADKKTELVKSVARYIGGRSG